MLEAYRRILEKRRSQMMDQVHWTRELTSGLEKSGLLTREELRDIEMELNPRNRIYAMLSKIMAREEVGIFNRFRQLLVDIGDSAMSESLVFDRSRIKWEFERHARVTSLPHYIQLLNTEVLQASTSEQDDYIRQCMFLEAKQRLEDLRISLRNQQQDRDNFRSQVWWSVTSKKTSFGELVVTVRDFASLSEVDDAESKKDEQLLSEVKASVAGLRGRATKLADENHLLRDELCRRGIALDFLKEVSTSIPAEVDGEGRRDSDNSDQDVFVNDFSDLEHTLEKNATNVRLSEATADVIPKPVSLIRADFEQLLQSVNSVLVGSTSQSISKSFTSMSDAVADDQTLIQTVRALISELEKWKIRSHQLRHDVFRLEEEREKIAREFGLPSLDGDRETFAQCVLHRMAEAVKECETLRNERRLLAERCGEMSDFEASAATFGRMYNRLRRISVDIPLAASGNTMEHTSGGNDGGRKSAQTSLASSSHVAHPLPPLGQLLQHQTSRTAPAHDHEDTSSPSKNETVSKNVIAHEGGKRRSLSTKNCGGGQHSVPSSTFVTSSKTNGRSRKLSLVGAHPQMTR